MAFTILRAGKYKSHASINKLTAHNFRITPQKVKGLKPENSHLNITVGCQTPDELKAKLKERIASCSRKARPDANRMVEFMHTASPEFFEGKTYEESKAYLQDGLDFVTEMYGEDNILSATFHFDEKTPHVHIMVVPIETSIRKTKHTEKTVTCLNAKAFIDGPAHLVKIQDKFAEYIQAKGHDLERGISKFETGAVHVPVPEYWDAKVKEADQINDAATALLAQASDEAKKAADLRRELEHSQLVIADELQTVQKSKLTVKELETSVAKKASQLDQELLNVPLVIEAKVQALESNYTSKEKALEEKAAKRTAGIDRLEAQVRERSTTQKEEVQRQARLKAEPIAKRLVDQQLLELFETELEPIPDAPKGLFSGAKWQEVYDTMKHNLLTLQKRLATSDRAISFARETYELRAKEDLKAQVKVDELTQQVSNLLKADAENGSIYNYMKHWLPEQTKAITAHYHYEKANEAERQKMDLAKHIPVLASIDKSKAAGVVSQFNLNPSTQYVDYSEGLSMDFNTTQTRKRKDAQAK